MDNKTAISRLRELIARDDLPAALQQLRTLLDNSPKLDEAIQQSARFHDIRKQIRLGTVSHSEANLTQNQIRAGLLDLLREIEEQAERLEIGPELAAFFGGGATVAQTAEKIYNIEKIDTANFS